MRVDVVPPMQRHRWADARLWGGLVIPSSAACTAGAGVLGDAPLEPESLAAGGRGQAPGPGSENSLRRRTISDKAGAAESAADRETVYGEVLGTCSECHALLGVRSPASP